MATKIVVNPPVKNLKRSVGCFTTVGYKFDPTATGSGGATHAESKDFGFMYRHGVQDPDGHIWALVQMEPSATRRG